MSPRCSRSSLHGGRGKDKHGVKAAQGTDELLARHWNTGPIQRIADGRSRYRDEEGDRSAEQEADHRAGKGSRRQRDDHRRQHEQDDDAGCDTAGNSAN